MMDEGYLASRFLDAARLLPYSLRAAAETLSRSEMAQAEELRLRAGYPPAVLLPGGEKRIRHSPVEPGELTDILEAATESSLHSAKESLRAGYVTARGGHRIGVCGTAVMRGGGVDGLRAVSSLALRVSKEIRGAGESAARELTRDGRFHPALIISPPGGGKTTLLRDMIRLISGGERGLRVAVADERGEIAAVSGGVPQADVGERTDVLSSCPRGEAVLMLLRAMNPEVIAMDEITAPEDARALESAANCGVGLLATAHARDAGELWRRGLYRRLLEAGVFERAVVISAGEQGRSVRVEALTREPC